jgi:hypothetical protein
MAGNFYRLLQQKREAAESGGNVPTTAGKPVEHMSLEELQRAESELRWEMTKAEYDRLAERKRANEAASGSGSPRAYVPRKQSFSLPRKKRPRWK